MHNVHEAMHYSTVGSHLELLLDFVNVVVVIQFICQLTGLHCGLVVAQSEQCSCFRLQNFISYTAFSSMCSMYLVGGWGVAVERNSSFGVAQSG